MWPGASVSGWYFSHPAVAVLRRRPPRPRPGRRLRRTQGLDADRGRAAGSPRAWATTLRTDPAGAPDHRGLVTNRSSEAGFVAVLTKPHGRRPCSGTWTAPSSTPSPTGSAAEYRLAERHGGTWDDRHALNLVGNDLLDSGRLHPRARRIDLTPEQIVELLLDDVVAQVEVRRPVAPGARELLAEATAGRRARRAGHHVLRAFRRPGARRAARRARSTRWSPGTPCQPRQAAPRALPERRAAARVAPERLPGHRGLRAGHHQRGRGRLHRLVVPQHVPVAPGERRVHLDTLQGVDHALLRSLAPSLASLSPCRCRSRTTRSIGDRGTAALVGRDGSVDWLCLPALRLPGLLRGAARRRGQRSLAAGAGGGARGRPGPTLGDTALLETTFTTATGAVTILDVMPTNDGRADLVRRLTGVRGTVRMRHEWVVRLDYGQDPPLGQPTPRRR